MERNILNTTLFIIIIENIDNTMKIRLTESDLRHIISESIMVYLTELDWRTAANAERKWAAHLKKHPDEPRRKSNIIGHKDSKGTHDITTDNRLRNFKKYRVDAFNKQFQYNKPYCNDTYDKEDGSYEMEWNADDVGTYGYYDKYTTTTQTPKTPTYKVPHRMKDRFNLDSFDGSDKYPRDRHETFVDFVDGKYRPNTKVRRDAVEPEWDGLTYMKARNKGNKAIEDYISGKSKYVKGKGWQ